MGIGTELFWYGEIDAVAELIFEEADQIEASVIANVWHVWEKHSSWNTNRISMCNRYNVGLIQWTAKHWK